MSEDRSFLENLAHYRKEIFMGIMIILLILFMVMNSQKVEFSMVFFKTEVPLIVLILLFSGIGAATIGIYWYLSNRDKKTTIKGLHKQIEKLQKDLNVSAQKLGQKAADEIKKSNLPPAEG